MSDHRTELEKVEELFAFLQGVIPDGCKIPKDHQPRLTPEQAWTVVWFLGNAYWEVPDYIERCDVCGELFDSHRDGACLDFGKVPVHFCGDCENGPEYQKKLSTREGRKYAKDNGLTE